VFVARYMPCSECGASVEQAVRDAHVCDRERWLDYQLFRHRHELSAFADELAAYFDSRRGRFEIWYAERRRRQG
jgi:hypothetical protein